MKRLRMTCCVLLGSLLLVSSSLHAQLGLRTGLKVGQTYANFTGDDAKDTEQLKSLTGGVSLELNLLVLSFQADLLYQTRGAVWEGDDENKLHYISVPVVVKKKFLPLLIHPYILAGPEWNWLISGKIEGTDIEADAQKMSMGAVVGAGLEFGLLGKSVYIEGRYHWGISRLSDVKSLDLKDKTAAVYIGLLF